MHVRLYRVVLRQLIMQNHIEQRLMDANAPVIFDETQLPKAIHEETHPRSRSADHLSEGLLRDMRDESLGLPGFAELRHEQKDSRQALLTRVK